MIESRAYIRRNLHSHDSVWRIKGRIWSVTGRFYDPGWFTIMLEID